VNLNEDLHPVRRLPTITKAATGHLQNDAGGTARGRALTDIYDVVLSFEKKGLGGRAECEQ